MRSPGGWIVRSAARVVDEACERKVRLGRLSEARLRGTFHRREPPTRWLACCYVPVMRWTRSTFAIAASTAFLFVTAACSSAQPSSESSATDALSTTAYSATAAVAYATAHWEDGVGECAEFVSDSLRAGHLPLPVIAWVPTLVEALASLPHDDHAQGDRSAPAQAGDVVIFSDGTGADFCPVDHMDDASCGHTCLVTVGGENEEDVEIDCHNNAHHHVPLASILGGEYLYYRLYHLSAGNTLPCNDDFTCNRGESGTEVVCSSSRHYCIKGCHSDDDCASGTACEHTEPHWSCH